jgi:predicted PurR-regulated permease PerM
MSPKYRARKAIVGKQRSRGACQLLKLAQMSERAISDTVLPAEPPSDPQVHARLAGSPAVAVKGLFLLALFYTFYFARSLLLPVVLAILLSLILYPAVRALRRMFIPEPAGAAIVVGSLAAFAVIGMLQLFEPASQWISKMPELAEQADRKLLGVRRSVEQVTKAAEQVEALASVEGKANASTPEVVTRQPSLMRRILAGTQSVLISAAATLVLLYFLLASGDLFLRKLVRVLPTLGDKKTAVAVARTVQTAIGRYLFTITVINACLGIATALGMYLLGMPNPMLWGAMVALLNFVPYIGAAASGIILTIVAFLTFDDLNHALLVPVVYFALETLEGQFLTPIFTGRSLTLNPVMIFMSMLLWSWMWGVIGAILAVPILMTIKIVCDHVESLQGLGEFLSGKSTRLQEE